MAGRVIGMAGCVIGTAGRVTGMAGRVTGNGRAESPVMAGWAHEGLRYRDTDWRTAFGTNQTVTPGMRGPNFSGRVPA